MINSSSDKLLQLVRAALGLLTEMEGLVVAGGVAEAGSKGQRSGHGPPGAPVTGAAGEYVSAWTGRDWKVASGGKPFYLPNTLAAQYANWFLHHPSAVISCFELERLVQPEKALARAPDSIQAESDAQARREYQQELRRLRAERPGVEAAGDRERLEALDEEIAAYEAARGGGNAPNSGRRAYDNVRKALRTFSLFLKKRGPEEKAFGEHLRTHLNIGFDCVYVPEDGREWG